MSPTMARLGSGMCWFLFLTVLYRWAAQVISLRQAIMYTDNNKGSRMKVKVTEADPV